MTWIFATCHGLQALCPRMAVNWCAPSMRLASLSAGGTTSFLRSIAKAGRAATTRTAVRSSGMARTCGPQRGGLSLFGDGVVMAEGWNGTAMPALATITNTSGAVFDPGQQPIFTLRIAAGYRRGALANRMGVEIRAGGSAEGALLFAGGIEGPEWGGDWTGGSRAAMGASRWVLCLPQPPGVWKSCCRAVRPMRCW